MCVCGGKGVQGLSAQQKILGTQSWIMLKHKEDQKENDERRQDDNLTEFGGTWNLGELGTEIR